MHQLWAGFTQMGREMSVLRCMEHIRRRNYTQGTCKQKTGIRPGIRKSKPVTLNDITGGDEPRIDMHDEELNRVLGGGLVPGSLVLLGGEPGIGKSTLVLQTVLHLPDKKVLYISGEESARQLKLRADRIPHNSSDC